MKTGGGLKKWNIDTGPGFKVIDNADSIQYVNEDESVVIYLSVLEIRGNSLVTDDVLPGDPKITGDTNGWQLKGVKKAAGQILVCVISFKDQDDTKRAKELFNSITYRNAG
ncbi:MAG TPA: hypothetical protein VGM41_00645 [Chitinophagaceae bacterium]|jgi:hypothetical protein